MLLSKKKRQEYLKALGYYNGKIDGVIGDKTKQAYKDLQDDYFDRSKDRDGKYGNNTDILLRSAYNCRDLKYFKLQEFKCGCDCKYCTGYPVELNRNLVVNLDSMRKHYGKAMRITSGLRCSKHNSKVGGAIGSYHKKGKAVDYNMTGKCTTLNGRKELIKYWDNTFSTARYSYCNGYGIKNGKVSYPTSKTMGNSVHADVK